jgi:putative CocE/NonD family hydrolase
MSRRWFDRYLTDATDGPADMLPQEPVTIFVMGENRWRSETEWPLARTIFTPYFLHSGGDAASGDGGELSIDRPGDEPGDSYRFDPDDPAPTTGGHFVGGGVVDQRTRQQRSDVLVYTSSALERDVEVTGPVTGTLHVSTSAFDADFVVYVSDVRPDGYCQNLVETIVRGRFRDSFTAPEPMSPGEVYELQLDLGCVSHVLFAGHRIRVDVSSSSFPRFERNLGTGQRLLDADPAAPVVATQTVWHDAVRASHVVLPVIPR